MSHLTQKPRGRKSRNEKNFIQWTIILILLFLPISIFVNNYLSLNLGLSRAIDFSIFQQALYEMAYGLDLNPYLSVRGLKVFNDHFSPILLTGIPWVLIFGYSVKSIVSFEAFWFFLLLFSVLIYSTKNDKDRNKLFIFLALLVFSRGILSGLRYPIHPQTWSIVPIFWLGYYLIKQDLKKIFIYSLILLFFTEIFIPIDAFILALYSWNQRGSKTFKIISFLFFIYICLFILTSTRYMQTSNVYIDILLANIKLILEGNFSFNKLYFSISSNIVSLIIFFYLSLRLWILKQKITLVSIFGIVVIYIMLHMFIGYGMVNHYSPAFASIMLGAFLAFSSLYNSKKFLIFILFVSFFQSIPVYKEVIASLMTHSRSGILMSKEMEIQKIKKLLDTESKTSVVVMSNELIPTMLTPGKKIMSLYFSYFKINIFNLILIDKQSMLFKHEDLTNLLNNCKKDASNILYESDNYFFARGLFSVNCIKKSKLELSSDTGMPLAQLQ